MKAFFHQHLGKLALLVLLSCYFNGNAFAAITCKNGPDPAAYIMTMPSGTFFVPRDATNGTLLTPWSDPQGKPNIWSNCNLVEGPEYDLYSRLTQVDGTITVGGKSYGYVNSGVSGIGLIMQINMGWYSGFQGSTTPGWYPNGYTPLTKSSWSATAGAGFASRTDGAIGQRMQFAFVKTGPISAGSTTISGVVAQAGINTYPSATPLYPEDIIISGGASFVIGACTTPDKIVPLGNHKTTEFGAVGTGTTPVAFSIDLIDCPAGLNSIQYRIDPTTTVVNSAQSVVALDSSSTATGVGVQLLASNGTTPFKLSTNQTFSAYDKINGGTFTIPLMARYYKTTATLTAGTANSSMTFTMTYQ